MITWKARKDEIMKELQRHIGREIQEKFDQKAVEWSKETQVMVLIEKILVRMFEKVDTDLHPDPYGILPPSHDAMMTVLRCFEKRMKSMMSGEIKSATQEYVNGEDFIDKIIDRINRKQLTKK